ncbi:inositol monophosphatase [Violaceomyces palustris]|uniref:Inositol monophosphatase n=1 Tax=Violaceomyces palustris TaxID=1673888 RepID=A0ACD0P639_9BASI|nr:inositol monophosphatase [Violaceomyces palustris]
MSGNVDLKEIFDFAVQLSKKAGRAIVEGSTNRFKNMEGFDEKKNTADLVTETDQNTEKLVKEEISSKYPGHKFIGEESWAAGDEAQLTDDPTWIIDPIDGTTNFVHGFPFTCISIGFCYKKEPVIGVIWAPFLEHLYTGLKGHGSHVTTPQDPAPRKLPLSNPLPLPSLRQALVAFEWGSDRRKMIMDMKTRSFARLCGDSDAGVEGGQMVQGVRSMGSAALNFANVAAGNLDLYWEIGCWAWDVCAGIVIAKEAGCQVVGSKSSTLSLIDSSELGSVTPEVLTGRKYLVVRSIGDSPKQPGPDAQRSIIQSFYQAIEEWDP